MESTLLKISNTFVINAQLIGSYGLLEGKMGIDLFLYYYFQISKSKICVDLADELIDEVSTNLYRQISNDFVTGLTGIGWSINHLIENKFIEAADDILKEMDESLKNISHSDILTDIEKECPFCSKGIYFTEKRDKEAIEKILNELNKYLIQNTRILPLSYLNSIMYMLLCGSDNLLIWKGLLNIIYLKVIDSIKMKQYIFPDAVLLSSLVEQLKQIQDKDFDCKKFETLLSMLDYDNLNGIFNIGIYNMIFNKLKFNDSLIVDKLETLNIEHHIDSIINDVGRNLNLYNGLAGTGLTLIKYFPRKIGQIQVL